jgi:hypothetical protein
MVTRISYLVKRIWPRVTSAALKVLAPCEVYLTNLMVGH